MSLLVEFLTTSIREHLLSDGFHSEYDSESESAEQQETTDDRDGDDGRIR